MEALWEKVSFWKTWKKSPMIEEGKHFRFVDFKDTEITGVEVLCPEFLGVVYHYHKVRVVEENGQAKLQFGYTIVHPGEHDLDDLNSNEEFYIMMGDILTYILMAKIEDETRNINSEKLNIL
jgi:hypothetical protein